MESLANANRPRPAMARSQRTYRVEMGGRTVLVSLGLAVLTGLVVFYMGVLAGKGSRTAETPDPSATLPIDPQAAAPGSLAFSDSLLKNKPVVEDLVQSQQQTSRETQDLLARAQRELTVEELPAAGLPSAEREKTAASAPSSAAAAPAARSEIRMEPKAEIRAEPKAQSRQEISKAVTPAPAAQRAPTAQAASRELYTVQVFSSKSRDSAVGLVNKLKGMGFAAYLNQFQGGDRATWYRVRVGRTNRTEAERIQSNLQQRANLSTTQVLPL